jgi:hypothetical protein
LTERSSFDGEEFFRRRGVLHMERSFFDGGNFISDREEFFRGKSDGLTI